jgi:hypothetical protein
MRTGRRVAPNDKPYKLETFIVPKINKCGRVWIILGLITTILTSACAQATPGSPTPSRVVVRILDLNVSLGTPTATQPPPTAVTIPTRAPTSTPAPELSPSAVIESNTTAPASPTPSCKNQAEFIKHLNISPNTVLEGGQPAAKLWQVKNVGDCVWTTGYALVFLSGDAMGGKSPIPLPHEVKPGEVIDLRVDMMLPDQAGTYTSNWALQDETGSIFGVGPQYDQALIVTIVVVPQPPPTHT